VEQTNENIFFAANLDISTTDDATVDVRVTIDGGFSGADARFQLVAPDALDARNTIEQHDAVRVVDGKITRIGGSVTFALPRWSVGVVELTE